MVPDETPSLCLPGCRWEAGERTSNRREEPVKYRSDEQRDHFLPTHIPCARNRGNDSISRGSWPLSLSLDSRHVDHDFRRSYIPDISVALAESCFTLSGSCSERRRRRRCTASTCRGQSLSRSSRHRRSKLPCWRQGIVRCDAVGRCP